MTDSEDEWEVMISRDGRRMLWKRYPNREQAKAVAKQLTASGKKATVRRKDVSI
jgi:hypothetical protein